MKNLSISVIVPVFNEEKNIRDAYSEIKSVLERLGLAYEIIFVNDGSTDNSWNTMKDIASKDKLFKTISFSRNFGQTAALVCGINAATNSVVIFMDGDMQNDPKDIPLLLKKIEEGYDVVSGWRKDRKDTFINRRFPSFLANKLISLLSGVRLHDYGCTLKAYKRDILKDVKLYGEMHRFIPIYASWVGAKIIELPVNHRPRVHGRTKYNIWRTLKVVLDLITIKFLASYGSRPIYIFGGTGLACFFISFMTLLMLLYNKLVLGISMIQSPLLMITALLVIIGVQFVLMGLIAEMQIRAYFESLEKPFYYVKEKINV